MSFFGKIIDSMKITDEIDDEEFEEDDDIEYEERPRGLFGSRSRSMEEDEEEEYEEPRSIFQPRKPTPVPTAKRSMEVSLVKPVAADDSREICDLLRSGKAVVINMEGIHTEVAQRIIDFTSGSTYAIDGKLQKISNYIFIATPPQVDLSGDFQDVFASGVFDASGLNFKI